MFYGFNTASGKHCCNGEVHVLSGNKGRKFQYRKR